MADIDIVSRKMVEYGSAGDDARYVKIEESQRQIEKKLAQTDVNTCELTKLENRYPEPSHIDKLARGGYTDLGVIDSIRCMTNLLVNIPTSQRESNISQYFGKLQQIGSESVSGYALLEEHKLFIIKAPRERDPKSLAETYHELAVGLTLNPLREFIPNFSVVVGSFSCSPPIMSPQYIDRGDSQPIDQKDMKKVVSTSYCSPDGKENVTYLIYEFVNNSVSMREFISRKECTVLEFLSVMIQIIFAIDIAHEKYDFTHYDLHYENVLIKDMGKEIEVVYELSSHKYYLKTRYVATIIDFGRSHVKKGNQHLGAYYSFYDELPDRSFPLFDIYKFLGFSLSVLINPSLESTTKTDEQLIREGMISNPKLFNSAKLILDLFEQDTEDNDYYAKYILQAREFYYVLPYNPKIGKMRAYTVYEKAIVPLFGNILPAIISEGFKNVHLPGGMYGCRANNACHTMEQILQIYPNVIVDSFAKAYDVIQYSAATKKTSLKKEADGILLKNFSKFDQELRLLFSASSLLIKKMELDRSKVDVISNNRITNASGIVKFHVYFVKYIKARDILNKMRHLLVVLSYMYKTYGNAKDVSQMNKELNNTTSVLSRHSQSFIQQRDSLINLLRSNQRIVDTLHSDSASKFIIDTFVKYVFEK